MPFKGFTGVTTITGFEELISMTITGELTELVIDPGVANTAPTVTTYYNPRYNVSIEGISSGTSVPATFQIGGNDFVRTAENYTRTVGDVVKVSATGIFNPGSSLGT